MSSSQTILPLRVVEARELNPLGRLRAADGALPSFRAGAPIRVRVELPAWHCCPVRAYVLEQGAARAGAPGALLVDDMGFPTQGHAFGRCGAAALRAIEQAGQPPGGGERVAR